MHEHGKRRGTGRAAAALLPALLLITGVGAAVAAGAAVPGERDWVSWGQETYHLEPGETFQFTVGFDQIPVRAWRLIVESDQIQGDLLVRRVADGSLLYSARNEARHEVDVPWGRGEQILVALSPGRLGGGVYTVTFLGPPPDSLPASYSYAVNRALEAFTAGRRDEARQLCEGAVAADPRDGAACVLLAGLLRDEGAWSRADALAAQALALELTPEMRAVAAGLREDVARRQAAGGAPAAGEAAPDSAKAGEGPSPLDLRLAAADARLAAGDALGAVALCDSLLHGGGAGLPGRVRGRLQSTRGDAFVALGRSFEAVDAYTLGLAATPAARDQAEIYLRLGRLLVTMKNPAQARKAFEFARRKGLPIALDAEAQRALEALDKRKD